MINDGAKANYVANTLAKLKHKKWELYIVSRIIHILNDFEIEFICQQLILLENGKWVFADIYYPQFNLCLEINERGGHSKLQDRLNDEKRQLEILKSIGATVIKIENFVTENEEISDANLGAINKQIDNFISILKAKKSASVTAGMFRPWSIQDQYDPMRHITKSYLDATENPHFRYIRDVLRCFGYRGGFYQRAAWKHPEWTNTIVWLPSFLPQNSWENQLIDSEKTIVETLLDRTKIEKHQGAPVDKFRLTFAKTRSPLGDRLYRFLGVFEFSGQTLKNGVLQNKHIFRSQKISLPDGKW